jgi:AcrR family transcriptional regulator
MFEKGRSRKRSGRKPPARKTGATIDARIRRSKDSVLRVTSDLLSESGVGGVSIDEVSRRSGVAKTTIYRHWPTRSDLVVDACSRLTVKQDVPDTGSLAGDLTVLLTNLAKLLRTARWSFVMPSIIDAAERDTGLAKIHSQIQLGHSAPFREVIERAIRRSEIPSHTDPRVMIAGLLGPLFYRRWFSREPLDEKFVRSVVKHVINSQDLKSKLG